ncbi:biotin/lipoyl-containing protein [Maritimibacter sp. HL-12]|uniref:biotin/lipoyl-containing protein n=1 Tax=Maritimibacter sp. HL-12 TaxID=1162418 RepID=UPI000A0F3345|nr:biotin/lipoyl-containing protein [Maritimibacter sp. HL-12]SMH39460.1 2-oxoglutarate dehydrogenase E2 component (dihydrolipoamide succinyltransferase) [Maritimibacter sp. HL-12]
MPHDVTMPQLGMAQDAGKIVSWLKAPGDAVAKGEALFEVETDKATMEVEAQADGFLTGVTASEGDDVPVGAVIARISDSAEEDAAAPAGAAEAPKADEDALPRGHSVTMPQLGMAQDTGVLVAWLKSPGDAVAAADLLFEVETDKSTMEVEAGRDGYLAATLAEAGEEVPVGGAVAIISDEAPANPVARSVSVSVSPEPAAAPTRQEAGPKPGPAPRPAAPQQAGGRILASPKARRLALEQGLDLARLADEGHPMPYHVADLDRLRALPSKAATGSAASAHLTARVPAEGFAGFTAFLDGAATRGAVWAAFAGASLRASTGAEALVVRVDQPTLATTVFFADPDFGPLSKTAPAEDPGPPALILRDLTGSRITGGALGAAEAPVLTITQDGEAYALSLDFAPGALDADAAIVLIDGFAGRLAEPLRHLL